jgi:hypothetical protein
MHIVAEAGCCAVCLQVLGDLPVDALPGVGWSLKGRLAELGIEQCREVRELLLSDLVGSSNSIRLNIKSAVCRVGWTWTVFVMRGTSQVSSSSKELLMCKWVAQAVHANLPGLRYTDTAHTCLRISQYALSLCHVDLGTV